MPVSSLTFLCISSYFKGLEFIRACKESGCTVYLLTTKSLENKPWPHTHIDDFFYMSEEDELQQSMQPIIQGLAKVMRTRRIDRIIALDDSDMEKAAVLREHFRIPGMGQTTTNYFRDKLAMRRKAAEAGINVPPFCALFNDKIIHHYTQTVSPPWIIKPRTDSPETSIVKIDTTDQLWEMLNSLGDNRHYYLLEQFKSGDVYHVDTLTVGGKITFDWCNRKLSTSMESAHRGGVFRSVTVPFESKTEKALKRLNAQVIKEYGMRYSACHTEIIQAQDDEKFYFLETTPRVGGAHIADMIEAASGINLWSEWAKLEVATAHNDTYILPPIKKVYSGIILALSHYENPDLSSFTDEEIAWRINEPHHVGFIVQSTLHNRVTELLETYTNRIYKEYHHTATV